MASGLIGNEVPGNRLRVRLPCPPLDFFWLYSGTGLILREVARLRTIAESGWLRPHRGIFQERLPIYIGFFQFVHNGRLRGKA